MNFIDFGFTIGLSVVLDLIVGVFLGRVDAVVTGGAGVEVEASVVVVVVGVVVVLVVVVMVVVLVVMVVVVVVVVVVLVVVGVVAVVVLVMVRGGEDGEVLLLDNTKLFSSHSTKSQIFGTCWNSSLITIGSTLIFMGKVRLAKSGWVRVFSSCGKNDGTFFRGLPGWELTEKQSWLSRGAHSLLKWLLGMQYFISCKYSKNRNSSNNSAFSLFLIGPMSIFLVQKSIDFQHSR